MWGDFRVSIQKILQTYRNQECLWNTEHSGYKNRTSREIAYSNMINDLNVPEITQNDIKLKIKSIRTTYRKELVLYLRRKSKGQENPEPRLVWFNQAHSFLKNVTASKSERNPINKHKFKMQTNQDDQLTEIISDDYNNSSYKDEIEDPIQLDDAIEINEYEKINNNENINKKKFVHSTDDETIPPIEEYSLDNQEDNQQTTSFIKINRNNRNVINMRNSNLSHHQNCSVLVEPEDEYQKFCNSVAAQLRAIPDSYARSMAKFKIQQILFEAETGQYKKNSIATISIANITSPT